MRLGLQVQREYCPTATAYHSRSSLLDILHGSLYTETSGSRCLAARSFLPIHDPSRESLPGIEQVLQYRPWVAFAFCLCSLSIDRSIYPRLNYDWKKMCEKKVLGIQILSPILVILSRSSVCNIHVNRRRRKIVNVTGTLPLADHGGTIMRHCHGCHRISMSTTPLYSMTLVASPHCVVRTPDSITHGDVSILTPILLALDHSRDDMTRSENGM
mgnify:CR=1 FL=1